MASISSNGASANPTNTSSMAQNQGGSRVSGRQPVGGKGSDTGRRPSGSPVDGSQRRNNPPKTWNPNSNPASQKNSTFHSHQNGAAARKAPPSPKPSPSKESNTPDLHAHDRLIFILTAAIGQTTTITTKTGEKFSGIFSTASLEPNDTSFILKMAQRTESDANGAGHQYLGQPPNHQMVFEAQDIADIDISALSTSGMMSKESNGPALNFRTDTDISGNQPGRERQLQPWEPGEDAMDMSLEASGSTTNWDQFEINNRLFGVTSSYDENIYTTRIDRSDPSYKRKEAEAARIAREIESSETDNAHLREERGHIQTSEGLDEEDKYSGVRRDESNFPPLISGQPNKYTPPARRPPAGQPTVPGAPVDPAIISAQVAQPGTTKRPSPPKSSATPPPKPAEATEQETVAEPAKAVAGGAAASTSSQRVAGVENAASNVETEVLDHFRRFANDEKMKLQERRRNQASYDRTIKLNELMKFSKNFKLRTPVPKDLVPILAKDPGKQEEIVERAKRQHEEKVESPTVKASAPRTGESKPTRAGGTSRADPGSAPIPVPDRQPFPRGRQGFPPTGPQTGRPLSHQPGHLGRPGPDMMLSHRLANIQQQRKGAAISSAQQAPIQDSRISPAAPSAGQDQPSTVSPQKTAPAASAMKFNARALEFKPNPAASTFTPAATTAVSSNPASNAPTRSVSRANSPSAFFGSKTVAPASQRPSIRDNFNPIKRLKRDATEQSLKDYAFNGGIPWAYRTAPTWDVSPINEEKTYADMFKGQAGAPSISPQSRSASNPQIPHQHQLPFHLQHGTPNAPPTTGPPHAHLIPLQPPHAAPPHFDDHRMQLSASSSQVYPSPRLQHSPMAYQPPVNSNAQIAMGQAVPPYYMGQGPQHSHARHYPGGPQFPNPQNGMAAPMMSHQASNGPYMGVPQGMGTPYNPPMQMYSPNPAHAYPQPVQPPLQPHSGFPSPSRGAPMMMHQGSQQGQPHQPVMAMNNGQHAPPFYVPQQPNHMPPVRGGHNRQHPHFSSSPHQSHHFPHHPYRNPSNNYNQNNQMPQMPPPPVQSQGPPQINSSAPHPPESAEEAK